MPLPAVDYPRVTDLNQEEKDKLLEEIVDHLGRKIERSTFDLGGERVSLISLVKLRV
jgi:hypothetical protein